MIQALLDAGVPLRRVRRAVQMLLEQGDDLAGFDRDRQSFVEELRAAEAPTSSP
jgi:hypothetical protein